MGRLHHVYGLTLLFLAMSSLLAAQTSDLATVAVRVSDASGAVLPGASVILQSRDRGFELRGVTDGRGGFSFNSLLPGPYRLTVTLLGFASFRVEDLRLTHERQLELPLVLQVGSPETTVTVSAGPGEIDTVGTAIRDSIPKEALREMPILMGYQSRSVLAQAPLLFPGASSFRFTGQGDNYGMSFSVAGSVIGGVGFYFDGIDNSFLIGDAGGSATVGPNPDALEEVSLEAQNYKAESGGHQAELHWRTRSGTNSFHGQARFLHLNPNLAARDFFAVEKSAGYMVNGAGFQLSGPLTLPGLYDGHNRTFWFFDNEWTRSSWQQVRLVDLPSDAERSGDFSSLPQNLWPVDPQTGSPFAGGRLPPNRILAQSRFYVDEFIPSAQSSGQTTATTTDRPAGYQFTTRLDHRLRGSDSLSTSLFYQDNRDTWNGGGTIGSQDHSVEHGQNLSMQYVRTLSSQKINSFTFGYTWWLLDELYAGKYRDADLIRQGYSIHNVSAGPHGYPAVSLDSNHFDPSGYVLKQTIRTLEWKDDFSLQRRRHGWKFGADLRRTGGDYIDGSVAEPSFSFSSSNPAGTGNDFADFLLGLPVNYAQGSDSTIRPHRHLGALYAQDDIQVRAGLTLNLGLRYDLNGALVEGDGHNAGFRPGRQSAVFPNAPVGVLFSGDFDPLMGRPMDSSLLPRDRNNFAPRAGLAWSPQSRSGFAARLFGGPGRTSFRAGYGLYSNLGLTTPMFNVGYLPPWSIYAFRDSSQMEASGGNFANPWGTDRDPFAGTLTQRDFYLPLGNVPYVEPGLRGPMQSQWTVSLQRQLPGSVTLEVAYLGNRAQHILRMFECNPALITPGANVSNAESRRTYPSYGKVRGFASDGNSVYHGLQVNASRRFSQRLLFDFHYVWSRTLDNSGGTGVFGMAQREVTPWGRANTDRTHNFAGYWVFELPAPFRSARLNYLLKGWRLSGDVQLRTGMPLQIRNAFDSTLQGLSTNMPDIIGPFREFDPREIHTFKLPNGIPATGNFLFDPSVFRTVRPAKPSDARIGNLGRNVFSGPGTTLVDLSLVREFRIRERHRIEIRGESTNAFNHAQFVANPSSQNSTIGVLFGRITSTAGARRIQFQMRYGF